MAQSDPRRLARRASTGDVGSGYRTGILRSLAQCPAQSTQCCLLRGVGWASIPVSQYPPAGRPNFRGLVLVHMICAAARSWRGETQRRPTSICICRALVWAFQNPADVLSTALSTFGEFRSSLISCCMSSIETCVSIYKVEFMSPAWFKCLRGA